MIQKKWLKHSWLNYAWKHLPKHIRLKLLSVKSLLPSFQCFQLICFRSTPAIIRAHKAYFLLDEVFLAGERQDTNKKDILKVMMAQDELADTAPENDFQEASQITSNTPTTRISYPFSVNLCRTRTGAPIWWAFRFAWWFLLRRWFLVSLNFSSEV